MSYSASAPTLDPGLQRKIEGMRNAAATIKDVSVRIRDTVRILRQSGAIDEVVSAVHESSIAMRDTTREISKVTSEIRKRGILRETAKTIDETISAAKDTSESLKNSLIEVKEEAPQTVEVIKKARVRTRGRKSGK
jgi:methyl-accepting chemotaxis protein